jgi:pilus assembly protein CpaE
MTASSRILAVGTPNSFREAVAHAVDTPVQLVEWAETPAGCLQLWAQGPGPVDLVVISPMVEYQDALELAESVHDSYPATATVLVREREMNGAFPAAIRAGVRDVVDLSKGPDELTEVLGRALSWSKSLQVLQDSTTGRDRSHQGSLISVFSSKGGTGKTFLACNLAAALAETTRTDTALVDLDLGMGDVFSYYGTESGRPLLDLVPLGEDIDRDAVLTVATRLGDHLYGFGSPSDPAAEKVSTEAAARLLKGLQASFHYVVLDLGPDYSDLNLAALDCSDEILLITGLDVVGIKHLSSALNTLTSIGLPRERFRVVLNRADSKVGIDAADVEHVLKVKVDAMVPSSRLVPASLNRGRPVYLEEPKSEVAKSLAGLAAKFVVEPPTPSGKQLAEPRRRLFRKSA